MRLPEESSGITGILYQHKDSTDTKLLGGLAIGVKLFDSETPVSLTAKRTQQRTSSSADRGLRGSCTDTRPDR